MKVTIPSFQTKQELFTYLKENKDDLISKKCSLPIKSDDNHYDYKVYGLTKDGQKANKIDSTIEVKPNEILVEIVGNTALYCDSQMDVLLPDCWKKTIKENGVTGKNRIYHLKDHQQDTGGIVGKFTDIYSQNMAIAELGYSAFGETQSLIFASTVKRSFDPKIYELYLEKVINQHSIGLQYVKLDLCINDASMTDEFGLWNKYYSQVINKEKINSAGYFWIVGEIKLYECSAVLFGSNELTPTLEPSDDTQKDEPEIIHSNKFNVLEAINKTKFLTI